MIDFTPYQAFHIEKRSKGTSMAIVHNETPFTIKAYFENGDLFPITPLELFSIPKRYEGFLLLIPRTKLSAMQGNMKINILEEAMP